MTATLTFERLDVYRVALEFRAALTKLLPRRGCADERDQIVRAANSVVFNVAEGAGRTTAPDKRKFYEMARGSAHECIAVLAVLVAAGEVDEQAASAARELMVRVV